MGNEAKIEELTSYIEELKEQNLTLNEELLEAQETHKIILLPSTKPVKTLKPNELFSYMVPLVEPKIFTDTEKHEFDRFVLITRRPREEEFDFSEMDIYFDDVDILMKSKTASAWFVLLDWITHDLPIFYCIFTEKDCEGYLDAQIDKEAIKNLKIDVLTRMYYADRAYLKRFDLEIAELRSWEIMKDKKIAMTNQKIEEELAQNMDDPFEDYTPRKTKSKWTTILLGLGWVVAFVEFLILIL